MGNEVSGTPEGRSHTTNSGSKASSALRNLESTMSYPDKDGEKIINILLLGETGVGKSTFINSVVNYLSFQSFEKAEKDSFIVLIPTTFMAYDNDGNNIRLQVGEKHKNEDNTVGSSVTQLIRTYTFSIKGGYRLRLIDTPGMGDTRGPEQDQKNCEYILGYISNLHNLHAICYLFRPQVSRATVHFRYCMTEILSRLEKSACDNLIFIFTDSKDFTPGETYSILKKLAEDIRKVPPHANIPVDKNKFCFDNEPFKYLAAKQQGVQFAIDIRRIMVENWNKSTEQCWKLLDYISRLKPHNVRNTAAINECRRIIQQLSKPMADIAQNIDDNLYMLERHEAHLKRDESSIEELKKKLFIPTVDLEVKELSQPVTVCTDSKCSEMYKVGERTKWHYKARCHNPCYLTNVTKDIIGDPALLHCYAMHGTQNCTECGCHYKQHMHVYYESNTVQKEKLDENVQKNLNSKEAVLDNARKVIEDIKKKRNELEAELDIIVTSNAKFAYFLQNNAITPINDCYEEYINHLINTENRLGSNADRTKVESLKQMLKQHNQIKATLKKAQEDRKKGGSILNVVTPEDIQTSVEELYKLPHTGTTIKRMYNAQNQSRESEYLDSEYVHEGEFDRQRHESPDSESNEGSEQKPSGSNRGESGQHNRGRGQNRGNRNNRGRNQSNSSRNYQTSNEAPPSYDQSWRDYGRNRPSNNQRSGQERGRQYSGQQRGNFQNSNFTAPQTGRGGFNRQNSGPQAGKGGFNRQNSDSNKNAPKIQVNVTIPAKAAQFKENDSSSSSQYDYPYNNEYNRNRTPQNHQYSQPSQSSYQNPQHDSYNTANQSSQRNYPNTNDGMHDQTSSSYANAPGHSYQNQPRGEYKNYPNNAYRPNSEHNSSYPREHYDKKTQSTVQVKDPYAYPGQQQSDYQSYPTNQTSGRNSVSQNLNQRPSDTNQTHKEYPYAFSAEHEIAGTFNVYPQNQEQRQSQPYRDDLYSRGRPSDQAYPCYEDDRNVRSTVKEFLHQPPQNQTRSEYQDYSRNQASHTNNVYQQNTGQRPTQTNLLSDRPYTTQEYLKEQEKYDLQSDIQSRLPMHEDHFGYSNPQKTAYRSQECINNQPNTQRPVLLPQPNNAKDAIQSVNHFNNSPKICEHPTAGSIVIEEYHGNAYSQNQNYLEKRNHYELEQPVGAPRNYVSPSMQDGSSNRPVDSQMLRGLPAQNYNKDYEQSRISQENTIKTRFYDDTETLVRAYEQEGPLYPDQRKLEGPSSRQYREINDERDHYELEQPVGAPRNYVPPSMQDSSSNHPVDPQMIRGLTAQNYNKDYEQSRILQENTIKSRYYDDPETLVRAYKQEGSLYPDLRKLDASSSRKYRDINDESYTEPIGHLIKNVPAKSFSNNDVKELSGLFDRSGIVSKDLQSECPVRPPRGVDNINLEYPQKMLSDPVKRAPQYDPRVNNSSTIAYQKNNGCQMESNRKDYHLYEERAQRPRDVSTISSEENPRYGGYLEREQIPIAQARTSIERHPENPFQTFEFLPQHSDSKQNATDPAYYSQRQEEDLISFDPSVNTKDYPDEFGKIDNPVRVIPQHERSFQSRPNEVQQIYPQSQPTNNFQNMGSRNDAYSRDLEQIRCPPTDYSKRYDNYNSQPPA